MRFFTHIHWHTSYVHFIILIGIVCVGVWFRFIQLPSSLWALPGYDESRDMLVARHVVEYGEWIWRGPLSSGSNNDLMNSPVYYWLLGAIWFVARSPLAFMVIWAGISSLSILIAYRVGTLAWDRYAGLILAGLVAVQPELVYNSSHMSQPYLLSLCSFIFLWIMLGKRPLSLGRLCLALAALLLPMHIHYGSLLLVPVGCLWIAVEVYRGYRRTGNVYWLLAPVCAGEFLIFFWSLLTYRFSLFDQQYFFSREVSTHALGLFLYVKDAMFASLHNMWWAMDGYAALAIMTLSALYVWWYGRRSAPLYVKKGVFWWIITLYIVPVVVSGLHGDEIHATYLLGTLSVMVVISGFALRAISADNRIVGCVAIMAVMALFATHSYNEMHLRQGKPSYAAYMIDMANVIYTDYVRTHPDIRSPQIALAVVAGKYLPFDGWGTGALWFHLEDLFGTRLVSLTNWGVNFVPIPSQVTDFYLVCDYRGLQRAPADVCVARFRSMRNYLKAGEEEIFRSDEFALWRFRIDQSKPIGGYNLVYPDLWHPPE